MCLTGATAAMDWTARPGLKARQDSQGREDRRAPRDRLDLLDPKENRAAMVSTAGTGSMVKTPPHYRASRGV